MRRMTRTFLKLAWKRYLQNRQSAEHRNIAFKLTFLEWSTLWLESGHWEERGRHNDQFCLSRFGDKGIYELGNVEIITSGENHRRRKLSKKSRELIATANRRKKSKKARRNMSLAHLGKSLPLATRKNMSIAQIRRRVREQEERRNSHL